MKNIDSMKFVVVNALGMAILSFLTQLASKHITGLAPLTDGETYLVFLILVLGSEVRARQRAIYDRIDARL